MSERITNIEMQEFLKDFEQHSETSILEEGKEKNEIFAIAKTKGINLKNNKDLAGFKTIYTFANKANKNRARLPKKSLLKALPTMIGKPVDIDHNRRYVIGHYIDYRYKQKEDMVVAYGVFYKSNFADEWEEAKLLFKAKKLATSYEIWCPKNKRRNLRDGTYELLQQEIAGGALLFKEEPAFEDAKVLELAKKNSEAMEEDLIFAQKYKDDELLMCKDSICTYEGDSWTVKDGDNITVEVATDGTSNETDSSPVKITSKVKCSNCEELFEYNGLGDVKCPKCFAILDRSGNMIHPPQIVDFKMLCPSCKVNRWLILRREEADADLRCMQCAKEYHIEFDTTKLSELVNKINFVYSGKVSCYQCHQPIEFSGISTVKTRMLTCKKCGLQFSHDISRSSYKKILKIVEIDKSTKNNAGGQDNMDYKIEQSKFHRYVDDYEKLEKALPSDYLDEIEEAKRLNYRERQALPDRLFAVVKRMKDKKTGKVRKIRMFPVHDDAHVRNALARLGQPAPKATLKRLGVSIEAVRAKILRRARQLKMTGLLKRYEKSQKENANVEKPNEFEGKTFEETKAIISKRLHGESCGKCEKSSDKALKRGILKLASRVRKAKDELKKAKADAEEKLELVKASAEKLYKRKAELGDFAKDLKDEDILDDKKFAQAKLDKENKKIETASAETVGDKSKDTDWYDKVRKEINDQAFPK